MGRSLRLSSRVGVESPNELTSARQAAVADGVAVWDLTDSNPTRHRLMDPAVMAIVARHLDEAAHYAPDPKGWLPAREALAARFGGRAEDYWLTASTSEAYSWLFTILADPGDAVGVPVPGYPLVEPLAKLAGLRTVPYSSFYVHPHGWELDLDAACGVAEKVRAMVVVNPNNPTGAYTPSAAAASIGEACAAAGIPLIADEVFFPFRLADPASCDSAQHDELRYAQDDGCPFPSPPDQDLSLRYAQDDEVGVAEGSATGEVGFADVSPSSSASVSPPSCGTPLLRHPARNAVESQDLRIADAASGTGAVIITLDGLSKLLAAPQLKVSWIRLSGPPELTAPLAEALDTIADTFLSVNSPVACALPELLTLADSSIARIRQRCATNLAALQGLGDDYRVRRTEGGWTALVDVPRVMDDDELGHRLLERGLAAHPGWFYDVGDTGSIAVSLLPTPGTFADSLMRLAAALGAHH